MTLPNDQVVAEAIRCSIVPVTSSVGDSLVEVTKGPIVEAALWKVISEFAENRMEYVMRLLLSGIKCQDKGKTAETAFCYYVTRCSAVNLRVGRRNLLSILFAPFSRSCRSSRSVCRVLLAKSLLFLTCRHCAPTDAFSGLSSGRMAPMTHPLCL